MLASMAGTAGLHFSNNISSEKEVVVSWFGVDVSLTFLAKPSWSQGGCPRSMPCVLTRLGGKH